jgi:hypothetical protein
MLAGFIRLLVYSCGNCDEQFGYTKAVNFLTYRKLLKMKYAPWRELVQISLVLWDLEIMRLFGINWILFRHNFTIYTIYTDV